MEDELIIPEGRAGDFLDVHVMHPVHNWVSIEELSESGEPATGSINYGYQYLTASEVIEKSVAFNNPWATSWKCGGTRRIGPFCPLYIF